MCLWELVTGKAQLSAQQALTRDVLFFIPYGNAVLLCLIYMTLSSLKGMHGNKDPRLWSCHW